LQNKIDTRHFSTHIIIIYCIVIVAMQIRYA